MKSFPRFIVTRFETCFPSEGAILFKETCSQCHALPDPSLHMAQERSAVVERMRGNMKAIGGRVITDQEKRETVAYLTINARN